MDIEAFGSYLHYAGQMFIFKQDYCNQCDSDECTIISVDGFTTFTVIGAIHHDTSPAELRGFVQGWIARG